MNSTIAKLADEFEKMEKTIASQKKMIETLMPTGYVDTDTVKMVGRRLSGLRRCGAGESDEEKEVNSCFTISTEPFSMSQTL